MARKTVIAAMTIYGGTPKKPEITAKGAELEIDAEDPEKLIERGIVIDPAAAPAEPVADGPSVQPSAGPTVSQQQ